MLLSKWFSSPISHHVPVPWQCRRKRPSTGASPSAPNDFNNCPPSPTRIPVHER
ncbi:hypothetical protein BDY21DRAFT_330448 [Lineolata rhizophorae]|uniref:Uncharacterized protein n=1 Tax=Lineolata rhizophorae TaxID=578093 RepID=A0A6A6PDQ1_9PEZI|nr:hypothetical protein BDY21DRAFT_330448 [Lineolata rhizophorae]